MQGHRHINIRERMNIQYLVEKRLFSLDISKKIDFSRHTIYHEILNNKNIKRHCFFISTILEYSTNRYTPSWDSPGAILGIL